MPILISVVHILKHGSAYCGQPGLPADWPDDHAWIGHDDEEHLVRADCAACLEAFDKDKKVVEGVMDS